MRTSPLVLVVLLAACSGDNSIGVVNSPPNVSIVGPADGTVVDEGQVILFEAAVDDDFDGDGDLAIRWSSSRDGEFPGPFFAQDGFTVFETANLTPGTHDMTIIVTDSKSESATDTIQVAVTDLPNAPEVTIIRPIAGEDVGEEGEPFEFVAQATDANDASTDLALTFSSSLDGVFCTPAADETGLARCEHVLSPGTHTLTVTAVDSDEDEASATVTFPVLGAEDVDNDGDGYTENEGDCNDEDGSVNPGAEEVYNDRDDDCDGTTDEGTQNYDDDGDGQTEVEGDCNDADASVYTGAPEVCDELDNDCDTLVDEGTVCFDDDGDGWTEVDGDCDDADATSYPGGTEVPDGNDNDCDGTTDEGTVNYDDDLDGYAEIDGDCDDSNASVSPAATEVCGDGVDNDCNGRADEANASGCTTYYYDYDGDNYGTSSMSQCLCSPSGYYTSAYGTDCYDSNASANPGATSWFTNNRGDGSFDYNCDSNQAKRYPSSGSCSGAVWICTTTTGWAGSVASCGASRAWITDCSGITCGRTTTTRTQQCR